VTTTLLTRNGFVKSTPRWFCEINSEIQQLPEFFDASPDEARETVEQARNLLDEAVKVAPDEIGSSVDIASDNFIQILDLFEEADFDEEQMDQAELGQPTSNRRSRVHTQR
jgi:hypothetical protein